MLLCNRSIAIELPNIELGTSRNQGMITGTRYEKIQQIGVENDFKMNLYSQRPMLVVVSFKFLVPRPSLRSMLPVPPVEVLNYFLPVCDAFGKSKVYRSSFLTQECWS